MGPQEELFSRQGIETFLSSEYTVTSDFDRMGCRLEGPFIAPKETRISFLTELLLALCQVALSWKADHSSL